MGQLRNGATSQGLYSVIPHDACPRCSVGASVSDTRLGMPVAYSGTPGTLTVRYVCWRCRLIWDTGWDVSGDTFLDDFICHDEGLESHPQYGNPFPVGPKEMLERRNAR